MIVFVINPGSTSTKLAVFDGQQCLTQDELQHDHTRLNKFKRVAEQFDFRMQSIMAFLKKRNIDVSTIRAVAGRGGLLRPLEGGVYAVSDKMVNDLLTARYGEHPCNLGAIMAQDLARQWDIPAYVVDPAVTDEMMDKARLTGLPGLERRSLFHALNQREVARQVAEKLGIVYENSNFLVCHMGGGITIGAHRKGRVVDVVNGLDGEGPFTPERTGGLPVIPVLDLARNSTETTDELRNAILRRGGLLALLGTNDPREVVARIEAGDTKARLVFESMAYNIARYLASMIPALVSDEGELAIAAIVLTGGLARSKPLVDKISRMIGHFAPVEVIPGEAEMRALAAGALRVLEGRVAPKRY